MSRLLELLGTRRVPSLAVMALVSVSFGGCSADYDSRFSDNSFQNPFASQRSDATGSVRQNNHYAQRELPQYSRPASHAPVVSAPLSYPAAQGNSGGGHGMASYTPPASNPIQHTGSVNAPRSVAATRPEGGTKIIVGTSDTMEILARRYNVSVADIVRANGYRGPRALSPGQSLIIPKRAAQAQAPAPATRGATMPSSVHVAAPGDTLMNISRRNHISVSELARANNLPVTAQLKVGDRITVPSSSKTLAAAQPAPAPAAPAQPVAAAAPPKPQPVAAKPVVTASVEPAQKVRMATETKEIERTHSPVKAAEATNALPTFRWPVRGRVITSYGAKTNGKQNDGINVAVPEGTPVKAAEDGVVAYSGNELKGYGNLILVRHANGYVTAYAHASELMVKRGDSIKRGQIIAKSGQTGEVGSPQLHFEIRKGSSPVDPLQFLNGA